MQGKHTQAKTACVRQVLVNMGLDKLINFQVCKSSCNTTSVSLHIWKFFTLPSVVIQRENFLRHRKISTFMLKEGT